MVTLAGACLLVFSVATAEEPLFEQEPYDQVTLDEANNNAVLQIQPLDLPGRRVPQNPRPSEKLTIRLLDKPGTPYEIQWYSIAKLELFEQLVLNKAGELAKVGRLDEAYDYFKFLKDKDPKLPGLDAAIEDYLYEEAKSLHLGQQYETALGVLRELYERNPQRPELEKALGVTTEVLVERHVAAENYQAARELIGNLAVWYPEHATVHKWQGQFKTQAGAFLNQARQALEAGQLPEAHRAGRRLVQIWPDLPDARQVVESIHGCYPRVVVGVTLPGAVSQPGQLHDWAARRRSRLLYRTLMEFVGPGTEGGKYHCPLGTMTPQELGLRMAFELQPGLHWSTGNATLTGYDLSRQLLAMADPQDRAYRAEWAELLDGVSVQDVYHVDADLRRRFVHPQALLQTVVLPYTVPADSKQPPWSNGPYAANAQTEEETCYVASPQYFAAGPKQPKEIVERHFLQGAQAIWALKHRQIEVLDRVNPWDVEKLRATEGLVVEPYAVPLVHCLVPNARKPFTSRRTFRRALVYGIHRKAILSRLLDGNQRDGCQVISGPFSAGMTPGDPLSYAYDDSVEPRGYEPRLAIALAQVVFQEVAAGKKDSPEELKAMPRLVLAHPPHEIARVACTAIKRQLELVGIPIALKELSPGLPARIPDDVDLLYVELAMWEPVVDARRVLDEDGMSGGASPYMSLALRQLELAADWPQVGQKLRQIHRIAHEDVAVVPLWQLVDHVACHESLKGMKPQPVSLYQDVEQWQPAFYYPAEEK